MRHESVFPSYPCYKESGIEWLGTIPDHWCTRLIKRTTYLKGRVGWKGLTSDEYVDNGYAYLVTGTDFSSKFVDWSKCHCVSQIRFEDDPFIQLTDGDLLITKDGTIGKLALVANLRKPACLNSGIFLLRPLSSYITPFLYWVLSSTVFGEFCNVSSMGSTILHLYQNVFENFAFPVPSAQEQQAIALFLDRETAKIDTLIEKQQRLIALLTEKRQAVISHAVTKGLDQNVPMKDSGIEWLGMVPEQWKVTRLGYYATVENGTTPSRDNAEYWIDGEVPWLSSGEVNQYVVTEASECISALALKECSLRILPKGSLIVGMIGEGKTRGMSALLNIEAAVNQNLAGIVPSHLLRSEYSHYTFQTAYSYLREAGRGGNQAAMNCEILRAMITPIPPIGEQRAIVTFLAHETAKILSLIAKANQTIDLMKERRTALISAAVTGKIDVRQVA